MYVKTPRTDCNLHHYHLSTQYSMLCASICLRLDATQLPSIFCPKPYVLRRGKISSGHMKTRTEQRLCKLNLQCHHLTSRGGRAGASILAVIPALVDLTAFATVVGLAAALWLFVGIQEATATVQTLDLTGATRRRCER